MKTRVRLKRGEVTKGSGRKKKEQKIKREKGQRDR